MMRNVGLRDEQSNIHVGSKRIQPAFFSSPSAPGLPVPLIEEEKNQEGKKRFSQTLRDRLGLKEFASLEVWRVSVAELIGTAVLVFSLDTLVISAYQTGIGTPNLLTFFFIFLTLTVLLLSTIPISGGHLNPVISFSAALVGLISFSRATIYIVAQCAGAVLGTLALKAIVSSSIEKTFSLGGCTLYAIEPGPNGPIKTGIEIGAALRLEILCTFVLLFAAVGVAFENIYAKAHGPLVVCSIIGLVVGLMSFSSMMITKEKGYAGAGMNPARCIGPALVGGGHLWDGHWVFWVGPTIACLAFYLYTKIIPRRHFYAFSES